VWLATSEDEGDVSEGSFLDVHLEGELPDAPPDGGFLMDPDAAPPMVTEIAGAIRHAKDDDRIGGLLLRIESPVAGWASMQELRTAVSEFRAAGKPCVAWVPTELGNDELFLASACETVVMPPTAISAVLGLSASVIYYGDLLNRFGVISEIEHVGDFKSAVEPYERSGPSEAASVAMDTLLDSLSGQFVEGVAAGRSMTTEQVQKVLDDPPLSPVAAQVAGFVDVIAWPDEVRQRSWRAKSGVKLDFAEAVDSLKPDELTDHYTTLKEYLKGYRHDASDGDKKIAVVHAEGTIMGGSGDFSDGVLTDEEYREWMAEARDDDDVVAVVVRVNSPGGAVLASSLMWREIERTQAAGKKVVVSFGDYAASGGYYMSANADWIVAQPGTLTGSIGVFGGKMALKETFAQYGVRQHAWKRGEHAQLLSMVEPFSDADRVVFRRWLEETYDRFLGVVADGRGLSRDEVHAVAQGRVWTGVQALERRLVDDLGGLDKAIAKARELAEVEDAGVIHLPRQKSFVDVLLEDLEDGQLDRAMSLVSETELDALRADAFRLEALFEQGPIALTPTVTVR
jgi:protease-4